MLDPNDVWDFDHVHMVWLGPNGAEVYVGGEDNITVEILRDNEIDAVITVNSQPNSIFVEVEAARVQNPRLEHHVLSFLDGAPTQQSAQGRQNAAKAVHLLAGYLKGGKRVVVHCRAGINRSTGVVYAALVAHGAFRNTYDAHLAVSRIRSMAGHRKNFVKWIQRSYMELYGDEAK